VSLAPVASRAFGRARRKRVFALLATLAVALAVILVGGPRHAFAQSAEAQALFDQGRRALAARQYAAACDKFEASEHIERAVGTLLSLAECEEALGRLAGARLHLQEAATLADAVQDPAKRGPVARARFADIDKRVPRLTLVLSPDAPKETRALRDQVDLGEGAFGTPLPVDPGRHTVTVSAAGRQDTSYEVELKEGEQRTLEVAPGVLLGNAPLPAPPTSPAPAAFHPSAREPARATDAPQPPSSSSSARRTWGYVVGGVGVAGLGVGTWLGVAALSTWSQAKKDCGAGCASGTHARQEESTAHTQATGSTISLVAGGAALAAGAYLILTTRSSSLPATGWRLAPWVGEGGAGASVSAGW
jgi:hypothetical protein